MEFLTAALVKQLGVAGLMIAVFVYVVVTIHKEQKSQRASGTDGEQLREMLKSVLAITASASQTIATNVAALNSVTEKFAEMRGTINNNHTLVSSQLDKCCEVVREGFSEASKEAVERQTHLDNKLHEVDKAVGVIAARIK